MTTRTDPHKGWRICVGCGQPFRYWRGNPTVCGDVCRVKMWRKARKGAASA